MEIERRNSIINHMNILLDCRAYLLTYDKSIDAQFKIKDKKFDGCYVEIESPEFGGSDGWIRLNYDDCYLYLYDDGTESYQLDPLSSCGAELIDVGSYHEFLEKLNSLGDIEKYYIW